MLFGLLVFVVFRLFVVEVSVLGSMSKDWLGVRLSLDLVGRLVFLLLVDSVDVSVCLYSLSFSVVDDSFSEKMEVFRVGVGSSFITI